MADRNDPWETPRDRGGRVVPRPTGESHVKPVVVASSLVLVLVLVLVPLVSRAETSAVRDAPWRLGIEADTITTLAFGGIAGDVRLAAPAFPHLRLNLAFGRYSLPQSVVDRTPANKGWSAQTDYSLGTGLLLFLR